MTQLERLKVEVGRLPTASGLRANYQTLSKLVEEAMPEEKGDGSINDLLWNKAYELELAMLRLADALQDIREDLL